MLTSEQINQLFDFCRKHYVQFYDVQVELVDHLANAIEDKMTLDTKLSFDNALQQVYAGFGITGFSKVVGTKTRAMEKKAHKLRWKLFLSYFTIPKIAMTACFLIALAILPSFFEWEIINYIFLGVWITLLVFEARAFSRMRRLRKEEKKPLLLMAAGAAEPFFSFVIITPWVWNIFSFDEKGITGLKQLVRYEVQVLIAVVIFVSILAWLEHLKQITQLARQQYPQAFAAA